MVGDEWDLLMQCGLVVKTWDRLMQTAFLEEF